VGLKFYVVAVEIQSSGNLGALARLCYNFQVEQLILIDPKCWIDNRAYERATDGKSYLENHLRYDTLESVLEMCDFMVGFTGVLSDQSKLNRSPIAIYPLANELSSKENGTCALIFGPEDVGLSNKHLSICDTIATIPLLGESKSSKILNISQAVGIVLYELMRDKINQLNEENSYLQLLSGEIKRRNDVLLKQVIETSRIPKNTQQKSLEVLRNILGRSVMTEKEGFTLIGIFNSILKTYENGPPNWENTID